jgi:membrane protein DedA with SNARE-associated domain
MCVEHLLNMPVALIAMLSGWTLVQRLGAFGLIILGIVDASFIPTPGSMDALTIVLAASHASWWPFYALMATAGSVIGAYLMFRIGRKGGKEGLEKRFGSQKMQKVYDRVERYGFGMVFVSAILPPPMPTVPFVLAAGALKYNRAKFVAAFSLGRVLRYGGEAYAASVYGKQILGFLTRFQRPLLWIFVSLIVAGAIAGVIMWQKQRRTSREPSKLAA